MPITILTTADRQKYNEFVQNHPLGNIHQTWEWGLFQGQNPDMDRIWFVVDMNEKKEIQSSALVLHRRLPRNLCWLYIPRGPLFDLQKPETLEPLLAEIRKIGQKHHAVFARFDPPVTEPAIAKFFAHIGAREAHQQYHPQDTLILDLSQNPDQLLTQMKPKGRYNIKVAQKHGVKIRISEPPQIPSDIKTFYELLLQTTGRDGFSGHDQRYYEEMLNNLGSNHAKLYLAEYEGKAVAAIITTYWKDTATYYFGASSNEYRHTMAPYLLQWQAILDAQKAGYRWYDFLGIAPQAEKSEPEEMDGKAPGSTKITRKNNSETRHHLAGVTDFKLKFGGKHVHFLPAQEIVYKPFWYAAIKLAKWWRDRRRK